MKLVLLLAAVAVGGLACDGRTSIGGLGAGGAAPSTSAPPPSTGAGGATEAPGTAPTTPVDTTGVQPELMARWNAAVDGTPSSFDFHWTAFTQFPHPTYKGGSAEAYQAFATLLLGFFQRGDDFDFLARNQLFTLHLVYIFPSGASGLDTSFQALAAYFASANSFGDIPADTRAALQIYVDRMMGASADAGVAQPDSAYAAMCRHYCEALHDTNIYGCVEGGRDFATCTQIAPAVDLCYELRCVPQLVTQALCFTQCDAVRGAYDAVCGASDGPSALCPTSSAEHDQACSDGCAIPPHGG